MNAIVTVLCAQVKAIILAVMNAICASIAYIKAWKSQDFNGVWTRGFTIPVWCFNQLTMGSGRVNESMMKLNQISFSNCEEMPEKVRKMCSISLLRKGTTSKKTRAKNCFAIINRVVAKVNLCKKIFAVSSIIYYMANPVLGKSMCSDWFFLGQDFAVRTVSMETVQSVYFCFEAKPANSKFATKTAKKKCE